MKILFALCILILLGAWVSEDYRERYEFMQKELRSLSLVIPYNHYTVRQLQRRIACIRLGRDCKKKRC